MIPALLLSVALAALSGAPRPEGRPPFSCRDVKGLAPGTVAALGGRTIVDDTLWILDSSPERPALLSISGRDALPLRHPIRPAEPLGTSNDGLARSNDGSLCALSASGRNLQCFAERAREPRSVRPLPSRAQALWTIAGDLAWGGFESRSGRSLVFTEKAGGGFAPADFVRSRPGENKEAAYFANLMACGIGSPARTPCWFFDTPEILDVSRNSGAKRIPLPEAAAPGVRYPIKDAAFAEGVLWVLATDPPARESDLAGDALKLLRRPDGGAVEVHPLPRPARALLRADAKAALLLFRDGGAAACGEVGP